MVTLPFVLFSAQTILDPSLHTSWPVSVSDHSMRFLVICSRAILTFTQFNGRFTYHLSNAYKNESIVLYDLHVTQVHNSLILYCHVFPSFATAYTMQKLRPSHPLTRERNDHVVRFWWTRTFLYEKRVFHHNQIFIILRRLLFQKWLLKCRQGVHSLSELITNQFLMQYSLMWRILDGCLDAMWNYSFE